MRDLKRTVRKPIPDEIHRGDVFYCRLPKGSAGSVQQGIRPVVVIQNDIGNEKSSTVMVACLTASIKSEEQPTHVIVNPSKSNGLSKRSMVMLEQVFTVDKEQLAFYLGQINDKNDIRQIDNAIAKSFALSKRKYSADRYANIEALCPKCLAKLQSFKSRTDANKNMFSIVRCDSFQKANLSCDRCGTNKAVWYFVAPNDCFKESNAFNEKANSRPNEKEVDTIE